MTQEATKAQELFSKTAEVLLRQKAEIGALKDENSKLAAVKCEHEREKRVRGLAKKAIDRGIIDGEYESVEDFVKQTLASDKSLDVIEQGIEFANGDLFKEGSSDDDEAGSFSGRPNPIAALLFGDSIEE